MDFTIDFWLGVIGGAVAIAVLTAIMGAIHEWRIRRAIRFLGFSPFPSRTRVNELETDMIRLARQKRGRDRHERDTRGTRRWELIGQVPSADEE
jgi:hypothetical protein